MHAARTASERDCAPRSFATVVPGKSGTGFDALPYSSAYPDDMLAVATELDAAAAALDESEGALAIYLLEAARAFRDSGRVRADLAWRALSDDRAKYYLRVCPDDVQRDACGHKAHFALTLARIDRGSHDWKRRLEPVQQAFEDDMAALAGPPYRDRLASNGSDPRQTSMSSSNAGARRCDAPGLTDQGTRRPQALRAHRALGRRRRRVESAARRAQARAGCGRPRRASCTPCAAREFLREPGTPRVAKWHRASELFPRRTRREGGYFASSRYAFRQRVVGDPLAV